jgi:2',3'-cyclic-nucleotide 2'-phosphodiesterase/3'-nucleotidase
MRLHALFLIFGSFVGFLGAREVTVTVLATTDLHGNLYPYDYLSGQPASRGLAKIATLIKAERRTAPGALVVDCGDTIQGSQLESVYQHFIETGKLPAGLTGPTTALTADPMMTAMNHIGFDAMAVGNHEFNYGLKNFDKARNEAKFPWLSANTETDPASGRQPLEPFIIKEVDGVRVGIIGITTPAVPTWEKPENYKGLSFVNARTAARNAVDELRSKHKADLVLIISHSGVDPARAETSETGLRENVTRELARIPGVDAIVFGHSHNQVEALRFGDVLLTQPKNWGISMARLDVKLESKPNGGFRVVSKTAKLIPASASVKPDPEILKIAEPFHELTERYLNTVVANTTHDMSAKTSRVEDTAIIDAIHRVQLHDAKADVSFASSFNPRAAIAKGPVTVRQIAALYLYDNELYAVNGTGQMVKDALENAARYFTGCSTADCSNTPLINSSVIGYNFDMAQGVTYDIDLTRPVGDRIRNLRYQGKPLGPQQKLRIALNNYRAGGSNGYTMFKGAKVLWRSYLDIRELILRYYADHELPSVPDNNWRVIPETAHQALRAEASQEIPVAK